MIIWKILQHALSGVENLKNTTNLSRIIQTQSLISRLYRWLAQHTANIQPTDGYIFIMPTKETKGDTGLLPHIIQEDISSESSSSLKISEDTLYSPTGLVETNTWVQHYSSEDLIKRLISCSFQNQTNSSRTSPSELPTGISWIQRRTRIFQISLESSSSLKISEDTLYSPIGSVETNTPDFIRRLISCSFQNQTIC